MTETTFDIVIVGGGTAGVSAAISASKDGMNVALVEKHLSLGGLAVHAEVGTICGIYKNSTVDQFEYNVGRFAQDFSEELQILSESTPLKDNTGLKFLPYNPKALSLQCENLLKKHQITVFLNTELHQITLDENRISSIRCEKEGVQFEVQCKAIVDATGVSLVSKLLKLDVIDTVLNQSASQIFTLSRIEFKSEANLSLVLMTAVRKAVLNGELQENQNRLYLVPGSLHEDEVSLKVTVPKDVNEDREELRSVALDAVREMMSFLTKRVSGFTDAKLKSIAPIVGVRIDDRPVGKVILNGKDVLDCVKPKDSIAHGNWPMEIWSQNRKVELRRLKQEDYYGISANCLMSGSVDNLFFAGRGISATDEAIASARVIGTCLQTGYASGKLASGNVRGERIEETIAQIQEEQF